MILPAVEFSVLCTDMGKEPWGPLFFAHLRDKVMDSCGKAWKWDASGYPVATGSSRDPIISPCFLTVWEGFVGSSSRISITINIVILYKILIFTLNIYSLWKGRTDHLHHKKIYLKDTIWQKRKNDFFSI